MAQTPVLVEPVGSVLTVTLNRPDKLNAFNEPMHEGLRAALAEAEADDAIRAVLITGAGRAFCAGQDLGERVMGEGDDPPDLGETLERLYEPLVRRIADLPKPVVAAVNGIAAGAGCNLALICDLIVAGRSAQFIEAFCRIGLVPDAGGTFALPRMVGLQRALGMALTGDAIDAERALAFGLVWKVVDDDALLDEGLDLARRLAAGPTTALGLTKRLLRNAAANDLEAQLALEREAQREAGRTADFREGVRAFVEKRDAHFSGR
ncbi:MAG TPA: 2-(1,2-epoxy-1,2-dihydrophenyl)acetyl-CoA isomerase PaaG [Geminicoccaceae bacterium]